MSPTSTSVWVIYRSCLAQTNNQLITAQNLTKMTLIKSHCINDVIFIPIHGVKHISIQSKRVTRIRHIQMS